MAINENVYGAPSSWFDCEYQQAALTHKNKTANFDPSGVFSPTLGLGVEAGKIAYNEPIDKSLSYCGLGSESALSNLLYYNNTGVVEYQERAVTNFCFMEKSNNVSIDLSNTAFNIRQSNLEYYTWETAATNNHINYSRQLKPLTLVNPNNIILSIFIKAFKNDLSGDINVTLKNYIDNYTTTYPLIECVYYKYWYGNLAETGNRTSLPFLYLDNRIPLQLSILDSYDIEILNLHFHVYDFQSPNIIGNVGLSYSNTNNGVNIFMYPPNAKDHIIFKTSGDNKYCFIEYYDGVIDDILKSVACFGLYFTPNDNICQLGALTDNDMYIGILDKDGIGHGKYLRGAATVNAPQNNYTDMSQSGYDYTKEVDKTKYTNNTQFYGTWSSSAFTKMYVLTESQVQQLAAELYTAVSAAPTSEEIERYNQSVFLTQNPIDCIISLKRFPLDLPYSAAVPLKLGSYTTQVNAAPLLYSTGVYSFVFSRSVDNNLYQWFDKSFLDYEPYTKVELSIPFCGTVEIPTTYIYDYDTIDVKLIVDFITGACSAYIQARNITIDSVSGECAVSLPVNGLQSATLDSQIHSAATARDKSALTNGLGLIGGAASLIIGIATGGIGLAVAGGAAAIGAAANMIVNDKNIDYELKHMEMPLKQIGSASGAIAQSYDMRCKMRITRPKISADYDAEVYANTIGFACLINTTVNNLSGLTVGDINLDGLDASDVEKQLIKNAFAGGVIL